MWGSHFGFLLHKIALGHPPQKKTSPVPIVNTHFKGIQGSLLPIAPTSSCHSSAND